MNNGNVISQIFHKVKQVLNIVQSSRNFVCWISIWYITKWWVGERLINNLKMLHYAWDRPNIYLCLV